MARLLTDFHEPRHHESSQYITATVFLIIATVKKKTFKWDFLAGRIDSQLEPEEPEEHVYSWQARHVAGTR